MIIIKLLIWALMLSITAMAVMALGPLGALIGLTCIVVIAYCLS
jgi:hypothetical protein